MGVPGFSHFIATVILNKNNNNRGYNNNTDTATLPPEIKDYKQNVIKEIKKHNKTIDEVINQSVDNFYIDLNGLIHPCCHPESGKLPKDENEMLQRIENEILRLVRFVQPKKLFYIAIDGVAPFAKQEQQRKRRFGAIFAKSTKMNLQQELGLKVNDNSWDYNQISPGTNFMAKVIERVNLTILKIFIEFPNLIIIFSDGTVPGEGEQKIMAFIKSQQVKFGEIFNEEVHVIHGLDADLIMLSSILKMKRVFALRDKDSNNRDIFDVVLFCKVLIHSVLDSTYQLLNNNNQSTLFANYVDEFNYSNMICDIILLFMFGGNDFLPSLPNFSVHNHAITRQLAAYSCFLKNQIEKNEELTYLIDLSTGNIRIDQLGNCLRNISESTVFELFTRMVLSTKRNEYYQGLEISIYKRSRKKHMLERMLNDMLPKVLKTKAIYSKYNIVERFFDGSKMSKIFDPYSWVMSEILRYKEDILKEYYEDKFGLNYNSLEIAKSFLKGLQWNFKYYFNSKPPSWSYNYNYNFSPSMTDICLACEELSKNNFSLGLNVFLKEQDEMAQRQKEELDDDNIPLTPFEQLISILPFESMPYCLPKKVIDIIIQDCNLQPYFPKEFNLDAYFNTVPHTFVAKLPSLNTKIIRTVFNNLEQLLSDEEKQLNQPGKDRIYFTSSIKINDEIDRLINGKLENRKNVNNNYVYDYTCYDFHPSQLVFDLEGITKLSTRQETKLGSLITECITYPATFISKAFNNDFQQLLNSFDKKDSDNHKRKERSFNDLENHNEKKRKGKKIVLSSTTTMVVGLNNGCGDGSNDKQMRPPIKAKRAK
ncbi:hypothetical protein ABK040_002767 [Willaertia magna]